MCIFVVMLISAWRIFIAKYRNFSKVNQKSCRQKCKLLMKTQLTVFESIFVIELTHRRHQIMCVGILLRILLVWWCKMLITKMSENVNALLVLTHIPIKVFQTPLPNWEWLLFLACLTETNQVSKLMSNIEK